MPPVSLLCAMHEFHNSRLPVAKAQLKKKCNLVISCQRTDGLSGFEILLNVDESACTSIKCRANKVQQKVAYVE